MNKVDVGVLTLRLLSFVPMVIVLAYLYHHRKDNGIVKRVRRLVIAATLLNILSELWRSYLRLWWAAGGCLHTFANDIAAVLVSLLSCGLSYWVLYEFMRIRKDGR